MQLLRSAAALSAATLLSAGGAAAQHGLSVSPNRLIVARATPAAGGTASSTNYSMRATVGLLTDAGPAATAATTLYAGLSGTDAALGPVPPVILAVGPDAGPKAGGTALTVLGIGLAGASELAVGGAPAGPLQVAGELALTADTPPGVYALTDPFGASIPGNSLGLTDVAATTPLGTATAAGGFTYLPALVQTSAAHLGQDLHLQFRSTPGALTTLAVGVPLPGVGLPLAGLGGALELLTDVVTVVGFVEADPAGVRDFVVPVPDQPGLVGATGWFQSASIDSLAPLSGEFTNLLPVVVQP